MFVRVALTWCWWSRISSSVALPKPEIVGSFSQGVEYEVIERAIDGADFMVGSLAEVAAGCLLRGGRSILDGDMAETLELRLMIEVKDQGTSDEDIVCLIRMKQDVNDVTFGLHIQNLANPLSFDLFLQPCT